MADIENKGTLPSIYRLYSLCVIYGLSLQNVLSWYGIDLGNLPGDAVRLSLRETRPLDFDSPEARTVSELPIEIEGNIDLTKTFYLSPHIRKWGPLPLSILGSLDLKCNRYAFIGIDDWFMHPILPPGSFIQVDETKNRVECMGSTKEYQRPIYLVEHRAGYRCGWCTEQNGLLIVQPHSESNMSLELFRYPGDADIIGQVTGVAKRLDLAKRRQTRS